jgi:hypothetical protein
MWVPGLYRLWRPTVGSAAAAAAAARLFTTLRLLEGSTRSSWHLSLFRRRLDRLMESATQLQWNMCMISASGTLGWDLARECLISATIFEIV